MKRRQAVVAEEMTLEICLRGRKKQREEAGQEAELTERRSANSGTLGEQAASVTLELTVPDSLHWKMWPSKVLRETSANGRILPTWYVSVTRPKRQEGRWLED